MGRFPTKPVQLLVGILVGFYTGELFVHYNQGNAPSLFHDTVCKLDTRTKPVDETIIPLDPPEPGPKIRISKTLKAPVPQPVTNNPAAPQITSGVKTKKFIYIAVITTADYLESRGLILWDTWGKYVSKKIFGRLDFYIGDKDAHALSPRVKSMLGKHIVRLRNVNDNAYPPQKKALLMLKTMWKKHGKNFQWFMRADDDVFIKVGQLEQFLRTLNSSHLHLLGQTGQGNHEEAGKLNLGNTDNYCMGGPGVIMSAPVLNKVGPNAPNCLKNHIYTWHEDVEVSRCIKKFAGVNCAWSYETGRKFYEHYKSRLGYIDPYESPHGPYDLELDYAITLHPNKRQPYTIKLDHYFKIDKIRSYQLEIIQLKREIADMSEKLAGRVIERAYDAKWPSLHRYKPDQIDRNDPVLRWNNFNQRNDYLESGRKGRTGPFKRVLKDVIAQVVKHLNDDSVHKGREVSFQQIEHGYWRLDPLHGTDYIVDIRLLYKRFLHKHLQVLVRKHAYVQQTFGTIYVREAAIIDGFLLQPAETQRAYDNFLRNAKARLDEVTVATPRQNEFEEPKDVDPAINLRGTDGKRVNIVIPLAGKYEATERWLENFSQHAVLTGELVSLTIVLNYFSGSDNSETYRVEELLVNFAAKHAEWAKDHLRVLRRRSSQFSRGISLDLGSDVPCQNERCGSNDESGHLDLAKTSNAVSSKTFQLEDGSLLFLCDIDVLFTRKFISNCQANTALGRSVYYPILFSEYDPGKHGYAQKSVVNFERKAAQLPVQISESTGSWRSYGFGLVCLHRHDLVSVGGFDTSLKGWGMEDVDLYSRFVAKASKVNIVRVQDPNLQHIYHPQKCTDDKFVDRTKLDMCERSRGSLLSSTWNLAKIWQIQSNRKL